MRNHARLFTLSLVPLMAVSISAADLTPTGSLRAAFLATNPVQGRVDPKTGEVTGPVADVVKELARRLGVPYKLVPSPDARAVIDNLKQRTADIGFLAYEEARAQEVDYAGPFAVMFNHYLVSAGSPLKQVAEVDRPGRRIGAVKGQTQQIFLSANIKQAQVRVFDMMPPPAEVQRLLVSGELDAFGLNAQRADDAVAGSKGALRVVSGSFLEVEQRFVVRKGEKENAEALNRFVEELRTSGFLKASLDRAKLVGVGVPAGRAR